MTRPDSSHAAQTPPIVSGDLLPALIRLATLQHETVDRMALWEAAGAASPDATPARQLAGVSKHLQVKPPRWRSSPDDSDLPALIAAPDGRWGILRARNSAGRWITDWIDGDLQRWTEVARDHLDDCQVANFRLASAYRASRSPVLRLIIDELASRKGVLAEVAVGGMLVAFLGLLTAFYTMQVYDRVIPTGAMQTLWVLTLGVFVAIGLEYLAKRVRSRLYERLIDEVDQRLARTVYLRFLGVRLDQLPASVGTLAGQLRGYESVRAFLVSVTSQMMVDAPFALIFVLIIAAIAGPLAYIPFAFFVVALLMGFWHGAKVRQLAARSQAAANRKTGLLVETVEAAEIVKSGQAGWRMLGRWVASTDEARTIDLEMRDLNESSHFRTIALQQCSYVLLVAFGAWMASKGELTLGGVIACSILSGRILTPVTQMGLQLTAWANVKAALQGLDVIWKLEDDHHGQAQPVHLDCIQGTFRAEAVVMELRGKPVLHLPKLNIGAGEKVGVLGPIGAGKTTLLRLLSGMYKPSEGRVWLDDVDLAHLSKPLLAEHIGYLPQDGRLVSGSLRDNLILGLVDPGDEIILGASRTTGLYESVIATHPSGLQQEIFEGGSGLSGGQRQLVNLTRVFLRKPRIWLLDEPTASLDRALELQLIGALKEAVQSNDTLVLVTHKLEMLRLVDRVIVIANQQIVLDGPRDAVLARLSGAQGAACTAPLRPVRRGAA